MLINYKSLKMVELFKLILKKLDKIIFYNTFFGKLIEFICGPY